MYPELHIRIWMSSRRNPSMIIGMSMGQETCRNPWTGFTQFTLLEEKPPDGYMWYGRRESRKQLPMRGRGTRFGHSMESIHTRVKLKLLRRRKEVYESFSSRRKSRKSSKLSIPWNLAKPVKIFPGIIVHQRLTVPRQMVLLRESYAGLKKGLLLYCCNQVWMKNGGRIPLNVTAICEKFTTSYQTGKHPTNGDLENHSRHPISAKDQPRLRQFGKRVLLGIFLGYAFFAVGIWTGDVVGRRH